METHKDYQISDIQERLFFIKETHIRKKLSLLCYFAYDIKCFTFSSVKERIEEINDSYIIKNVSNGLFDEVLKEIFSKKLWSEGY